jgi:hypothetical protein
MIFKRTCHVEVTGFVKNCQSSGHVCEHPRVYVRCLVCVVSGSREAEFNKGTYRYQMARKREVSNFFMARKIVATC